MTRYRILGGGHVEAPSASLLVEELRQDSFTKAETAAAFMDDYARRCRIQTGATVRTDTPENFVADLVEGGFLEEEA